MAQVYRAPEGFEPPRISLDALRDGTYQEQEQAYLDRLADRAKMNGTNPLHGEVIRWQRADGYAEYMVWTTSPLALIHLELGDAYSVEDVLLRGLRLADVRDMVARQQALRAMFSKSDTTTQEN